MKDFAKKILPDYFIQILKNVFIFFHRKKIRQKLKRSYKYDLLRYSKYSRTFGNDNPAKMMGTIIVQYHVIEKGLTIPETRLGFGKISVIALCKSCMEYITTYGQNHEQLDHAIGVILEYEEHHESRSFILDDEVTAVISQLKELIREGIESTAQIQTTKNAFFKKVNSPFLEFSNSRSSIRNYTKEDLSLVKILDALELARNTPSACNRQAWRTYVFSDKKKIAKILEAQGGNRGFGHLANKLIVITGELGVFCNTNERNQVFIDGGMYAMNLLYALHYNEIAACILNCSFDFEKEHEIKEFSGIKESEVLVAMVACGVAPVKFKIALSPRNSLEETNIIVD
ncbi:MAG: nitroreductase family protein [Candidatus Krumholzibacteriota bacterium]|nr:nitroreductase family protein [Candidatus Krumholzibacteriota bacterium]